MRNVKTKPRNDRLERRLLNVYVVYD